VTEQRTLVPLGPFHPLLAEPAFYQLVTEGERIVDLGVRMGYGHRGVELLSTRKTWKGCVELSARLGAGSAAAQSLAFVLAIEEIAGVKPPPRAERLRTVVLELERIASHLMWLGHFARAVGSDLIFARSWQLREEVLGTLEMLTGSRVVSSNATFGGVDLDIDGGMTDALRSLCERMGPEIEHLSRLVESDSVIAERTSGVGVLSADDAAALGAVGPVARAAGIAADIRRDDPYGAYGEIEWDVVTRTEGDVHAMTMVRLGELGQSVRIVSACLEDMPTGPVAVPVDRVPPGEGLGRVESPRGETFHYVLSDGGNSPVRHKIRAASYMNIPTLARRAVGETISDAALIIVSVDPSHTSAERMLRARCARRDGDLSADDLVALSRARSAGLGNGLGA